MGLALVVRRPGEPITQEVRVDEKGRRIGHVQGLSRALNLLVTSSVCGFFFGLDL